MFKKLKITKIYLLGSPKKDCLLVLTGHFTADNEIVKTKVEQTLIKRDLFIKHGVHQQNNQLGRVSGPLISCTLKH